MDRMMVVRGAASALALAALAPGAASAQAAGPGPSDLEEVVVTGSRLEVSGFEAPTPVTAVSAAELKSAAPRDLSDALNFLPQFRGSAIPTNGGTSASNTNGANLLNLRGLGPQRTLVLLDGRRVIASNTAGSTDVSLLPQELVRRVDIVTGGASAAYGSDAVSGVVNFVLDERFEGLKGEALAGISRYHDSGSARASVAYGTGFAGDRGHFIASGEYYYIDDIGPYDEGFYDAERDWVKASWGIIPNPVTGARPTRLIVRDVRHANGNYGGLITSGPLRGTTFGPGGVPQTFNFGSNVGSVWMTGGDGVFPFENFTSSIERWSVFAHAAFDVSDSLKVYAEAQAGHTRNKSAQFLEFSTGQFAMTIFRDNAFLPASIRTRMTDLNLASFSLGRFHSDMPVPTIDARNAMQRLVVGFDGKLGKNWTFGGYYTRGWDQASTRDTSILKHRNFYAAVDAVLDPATGRAVCRSTLAGLDPGCVPFNPFGAGSPSQEAIAYVTGENWRDTRFTQDVAAFTVHGELPFSLGAGPVAMAAGVEYRRETSDQTSDPLSRQRVDFTGVRGGPTPVNNQLGGWIIGNFQALSGKYDIREGFVELGAKVLEDQPFAKLLDVNGAIRVADYSTTGSVTTWKVGASYSPVDDLRFRITRSRDIRSANMIELFTGAQQRALNFVTNSVTGAQIPYIGISTGNPDLAPEKADTLTGGIVYEPSWAPRLRLAVDAYDIKVDGAISSLTPQVTYDQCAQGVQLACAQISDIGAGTLRILLPFLNLQSQRNQGVDVELGYQTEALGGDLTLRVFFNQILKATSVTPGAPALDNTDAPGKRKGMASLTYERSRWSLNLQERYLSGGLYNTTFVEGRDVNDNSLPAVWYTDVTARLKLDRAGERELFLTINNLFDKDPPVSPVVSTFMDGANKALYDPIGRYYTAGFRFRY